MVILEKEREKIGKIALFFADNTAENMETSRFFFFQLVSHLCMTFIRTIVNEKEYIISTKEEKKKKNRGDEFSSRLFPYN